MSVLIIEKELNISLWGGLVQLLFRKLDMQITSDPAISIIALYV